MLEISVFITNRGEKNLEQCMKILSGINDKRIDFNIYGNIEDKDYWGKCRSYIPQMTENIRVKYCGEVKPDDVEKGFKEHDVFLFPTRGENFGHVIYEALSVGCIPIISDQTPWSDFDIYDCGYIVPINDIDVFRKDICELADKNGKNLVEIKTNAIKYAQQSYNRIVQNTGYNRVFLALR